MDEQDRIYALKVISKQHNHGNIIDSNHGNGTQPHKDFEVFKKHRVNDHLLILLLSLGTAIIENLTSAVRETGVSRQDEVQLRAPLKPPNTTVP